MAGRDLGHKPAGQDLVGQGTRLFPDTGRDTALELVRSQATPSGVTIHVYGTAGRTRLIE